MNRHLGLFLLTALTTTAAGALHHTAFLDAFGTRHIPLSWGQLALGGLWFSVPFLGFLTAHEFGHYFAGRAHGLRPSLPYYLPVPLPLTGTLGAVIFFRGHFPNRRVLFDFAAGGPIAGFVVAVAALAAGLAWSPIQRLPERFVGQWLAEPLLFQWLASGIVGPIPDGSSINLHPTAFAGWLGLLFTMMNLVPISQLDGGHITYAVARRASRWITVTALAGMIGLIVWLEAYSWVLWVGLLVVMMRFIGWEHPAALDDDLPLDSGRVVVALLVLAIFIVCFMPVPISPIEFAGG